MSTWPLYLSTSVVQGVEVAYWLFLPSCSFISAWLAETWMSVFRGTPFFFVLGYHTVPAFEPH
jgi:hypothetical protein